MTNRERLILGKLIPGLAPPPAAVENLAKAFEIGTFAALFEKRSRIHGAIFSATAIVMNWFMLMPSRSAALTRALSSSIVVDSFWLIHDLIL